MRWAFPTVAVTSLVLLALGGLAYVDVAGEVSLDRPQSPAPVTPSPNDAGSDGAAAGDDDEPGTDDGAADAESSKGSAGAVGRDTKGRDGRTARDGERLAYTGSSRLGFTALGLLLICTGAGCIAAAALPRRPRPVSAP